MSEPDAVLGLDRASFGYAGRAVVGEVSLTIRPGEVVALLGPNGSGKSTLVRGLLGLNDHLGGRLSLGDPALTTASPSDRRFIGYVPQRHTLSTSVRATAREVVATGRLAHRPWWRRATTHDDSLVRDALETVGLGDRAEAEVSELSGGQQRRVLIARALAGEPSMLVLDEPMAGVDRGSQEVLTRLLHRLVDRGATMLVVTHDLSMLSEVITRIVALEAGEVVFDGSPGAYRDRLLDQPLGTVAQPAHEQPPAGTSWWVGPVDPREESTHA
ncbi:MAG TPA: ATP-binding cassette domain-containing protein [Ornithinimicrobium sp.]|uniref:metal ABC transporter ATP-binding protein n=1 Tax=Ornithinimicrobium sp. TaxID=1977084 RepID=UPI002B460CCE|nr:ATP-binding cassette domain-containing protein [Ornithinimicrobium sp.]HKJ12028.1 ATP-binding cassette domain-containing protein [Ornithinimicrobium sp.]